MVLESGKNSDFFQDHQLVKEERSILAQQRTFRTM